jgi:hypothetical protein
MSLKVAPDPLFVSRRAEALLVATSLSNTDGRTIMMIACRNWRPI